MEHDNLILPAEDATPSQQRSQSASRMSNDGHDRLETPELLEQSSKPGKREAQAITQRSSYLQHSPVVILWVLIYTTLALFAWVVLCILTSRPITATGSYGRFTLNEQLLCFINLSELTFSAGVDFEGSPAYGWTGASVYHSFYTRNERWLRAAEIARSIAAVLTIPLTSTVCSKAAATWIQRQAHGRLSLRQTLTLADRGWVDPTIFLQLVTGGFKRYATKFLIGAAVLNIIGSVIAPLQAFYLTTATIKTPTWPDMVPMAIDFADHFDENARIGDNNIVPVKLRSALASIGNTSPQGRLWTGQSINCSQALKKSDVDSEGLPMNCVVPNMVFGNMSILPDPFVAELPAGYSTGTIRQYLPRINSTARRDTITESEYPANCDKLKNALHVKFGATNPNPTHMTGWGNWSLEACMPADLSVSPWRAVRTRQDFSEELFLNISLVSNDPMSGFRTPQERGGLFRIVVNTTGGFFELPNYMNGQQPGPLLAGDPMDDCTRDCAYQGMSSANDSSDEATSGTSPEGSTEHFNESTNPIMILEGQANRGPLLTIALALFGSGSFMAERMAQPEAYLTPNITDEQREADLGGSVCMDQVPLMNLLHSYRDARQTGNILDPCVKNNAHTTDDIQRQVTTFVRSLYWNKEDGYDGGRIANAFTAAAFLANEAWMFSQPLLPSWSIRYDAGADTGVPVISRQGIIVISTFLGVYIASIFALAIYSVIHPRWTDHLDAFAMLRIGASMAGDIKFRPANDAMKITALDHLPGWIGDGTGGDGEFGHLAMGASRRLKSSRKFRAYDA